jgi:hypothetical protein
MLRISQILLIKNIHLNASIQYISLTILHGSEQLHVTYYSNERLAQDESHVVAFL